MGESIVIGLISFSYTIEEPFLLRAIILPLSSIPDRGYTPFTQRKSLGQRTFYCQYIYLVLGWHTSSGIPSIDRALPLDNDFNPKSSKNSLYMLLNFFLPFSICTTFNSDFKCSNFLTTGIQAYISSGMFNFCLCTFALSSFSKIFTISRWDLVSGRKTSSPYLKILAYAHQVFYRNHLIL